MGISVVAVYVATDVAAVADVAADVAAVAADAAGVAAGAVAVVAAAAAFGDLKQCRVLFRFYSFLIVMEKW